MIIIIEGIDRVGKTTLANRLSEKFKIPIYKQERIGGNDKTSQDISLQNYIRAKSLVEFWNWNGFNQHIIMDRFHWTESVYSIVERDDIEQTRRMRNVEGDMLKQKDKYFIIHVMPVDIKWCNKQHGSNLNKHQNEFDKLYDESRLNKKKCTFYSFDIIEKTISEML